MDRAVTSESTDMMTTRSHKSSDVTPTLIFVYLSFAVGGVILIVAALLIVIFIIRYRRRRLQLEKEAAVQKLSMTSTASNATNATRVYNRALRNSSGVGYFESATVADNICYSSQTSSSASSTHNANSSTPTASSSSAGAVRAPDSPDTDHRLVLHRSSPLTGLNSIYVIDDHVTGRDWSRSGDGMVNGGFVGDGILTDSWRRVSWRARLRAGIARSTLSSDPGPPRGQTVVRQPSYLSDVIDSVSFFSNAGESDQQTDRALHPRRHLPLRDLTRCGSDGGEWSKRRNNPSLRRHVLADHLRHQHIYRQPHLAPTHTRHTYSKSTPPSSETTTNKITARSQSRQSEMVRR